ncbi:MAG: Rieske 2Fe-2S domain-containing protein [Acaryochloris sp. RU_4_1]|nr:Rieske 2Fe-2S domain-containing protein [Acaryochloris sp. RU_4_1]NJR56823.1 Rieske 2Fe-2S domain-containing protein [Acaryochloris sp. CRU_2_0]
MTTRSSHPQFPLISGLQRRRFLQYMLGSATATITLGFLWPAESVEPTLENLCSASPLNSRCKDYLPGVQAKNKDGQPLKVDQLLSTAQPGDRIGVKGLADPRLAYLVITDPPRIAEYAINPTCTHLGCTVKWEANQHQFVCPCHGSRYDNQGRVVKGPAKRNLGLTTVVVKQNQVRLVARPLAIDPRVKGP